jgi:hypothetical protein
MNGCARSAVATTGTILFCWRRAYGSLKAYDQAALPRGVGDLTPQEKRDRPHCTRRVGALKVEEESPALADLRRGS